MVAPLDDVAGWSYARTMGQELCVIFFPGICVLVTLGFDLYVAISVSNYSFYTLRGRMLVRRAAMQFVFSGWIIY